MAAWAFRDAPLREALSSQAIPKLSQFRTQDLCNTSWSVASMSEPDWPLLAAIAAAARHLLSFLDLPVAQASEAFDLSSSLQALSWSLAFAAKVWAEHPASGGSREAADWPMAVARALLTDILILGRELDARAAKGDEAQEGSRLAWAARVAPAQGAARAELAANAGAAAAELRRAAEDGRLCTQEEPEVCAPQVLALPRGMVVVSKPVNWEVDGLTSEGGGAKLLSSFLQSALPDGGGPVARAPELDFGFVHRLDVPSSGLVLGGTSLEGLFHLKWQIAVYAIDRQYITANHGRLPEARGEVGERIDAPAIRGSRSLTDEGGKPARTFLESLSHVRFSDKAFTGSCRRASGDALSLLAITIHTGRRHQIRAHTRHFGSPTVADWRYAPRDVMLQGTRVLPLS